MMERTQARRAIGTLRYIISDEEYELLHKRLLKRAPGPLNGSAFTPEDYHKVIATTDDYHAATTRSALRVFLSVSAGLKSWDIIASKLLSKGKDSPSTAKSKTPFLRSPTFRLALSLSSVLYLHRLLHRFFLRLRLRLLSQKAEQLRKRHPYVLKSLTSRYAPALGASLAGLSLGIYPKAQLRITVALYMASRALEFLYNAFEAEGYMRNKPSWLGSWLLFPLAQGEILYALVFDRDCAPKSYGDFILKHTPSYLQERPATISSTVPWPGTYEIIDALAEMSRLRWPKFISPIVLPNNPNPLPQTIDPSISSITSSAHPLLHNHPLSCALLHPSSPSCLQAFLTHMLLSSQSFLRFFTLIFTALSLASYKKFKTSPLHALNSLSARILKTTFIITSATGVAWSSICLFQSVLPRKFLPQLRFALGGFLGGSFAYFDRNSGILTGTAMDAARLSVNSLWKIGVKHRWWRGVQGGDVLLFTAGLAVMGSVAERNSTAIAGGRGWEKWVLDVFNGDRELGLANKRTTEIAETTAAAGGDGEAANQASTQGETLQQSESGNGGSGDRNGNVSGTSADEGMGGSEWQEVANSRTVV